MKTAQIIINVGYLRDAASSPNFGTAYLCQDDTGVYFIAVWKAAYNDASGTAIAAGWGWIPRNKILSGEFESNISNSVKNLLVADPVWTSDEIVQYNNLEVGVITNGGTLAGLTTNIKALASEIPTMYTAVGDGFVLADVKSDLGLTGLTIPTTSTTVITANAMAFPTLDKQPVEAVQAFIKKPLDFAKANPISAGAIVLGVVQIGNALSLWTPNPLGVIGVKNKVTKKKAAFGF